MILPVRRGGLGRQQRKYPFTRRKKEYLAKKGRRQDLDPPFAPLLLCAFARKKSAAADPQRRGDAKI